MQAVANTAPREGGGKALGEYLVEAGKLESDNVQRALKLQSRQADNERIGSILVKLGLVSERDIAQCLSQQLDVRLLDRADMPTEPLAQSSVSPRFLKLHMAVIVDEDDRHLTLALADPQDDYVLKAMRLCSGKPVEACIGLPADIEVALARQYSDTAAEAGPGDDTDLSAQFVDDVEQLRELAGEAPVIKLVNRLLHQAAEAGASDVHIEPFQDQLKVRYRIDGLLREREMPATASAAAIISRIKIMANMNIAERRLAQDGRFRHRVGGNEYDLRVSTVPTLHGESVVMRLLRRDGATLDFDALGFSPQQAEIMRDILALPHGILLVTGPTGSGKSTTLYAALSHLNRPERMIITVEDPVEYNIHGINQMQVKPQIGLTFANALRSIVRQDPDIIMIGEMRDTETARIAVQSALTGHLVLSTLHTNDAAGSIMRLLDMGVEDYLLSSAVNAVQAQRLVRTLCRHCAEPYTPIDEVVARWQLDRFTADGKVSLHRAVGCDACGQSGYTGRSAILEILRLSADIKRLVMRQTDAGQIAAAAVAEGMVPMRDDGLLKAVAGTTTLEEVLRVTPEQGDGYLSV